MQDRKKKLEILYIDDILNLSNDILSSRTNHYLRSFLFNLRLLFRYNSDDLDDLINVYYYVEDILKNDVLMNLDELKILIYQLNDLLVNLDEYDVRGQTVVSECLSNLLYSLYLELETYRLVDKIDEDDKWKDILLGQVKNQMVEFNVLLRILVLSDNDEVNSLVLDVLNNNYPMEFAVYKARNGILD